MAWYWWVLIAAGLVGFIFLKIKVGGSWMKKRKAKEERRAASYEDED